MARTVKRWRHRLQLWMGEDGDRAGKSTVVDEIAGAFVNNTICHIWFTLHWGEGVMGETVSRIVNRL